MRPDVCHVITVSTITPKQVEEFWPTLTQIPRSDELIRFECGGVTVNVTTKSDL